MTLGDRIDALCSDGRVRRALILRDADTFFTTPARVKVCGRTITGFVWRDREGTVGFTPDRWRANAHMLPRWP